MERATFLTRVVLENYKSIAHCDVRLGPLNYLVGPNGAGKSNFLDALRFAGDALEHSVQHALRNRGGGASICYAPNQKQGYFRIQLEFRAQDEKVGHYSLKVGAARGVAGSASWEVQEETVGVPTPGGEAGTGLRAQHQLHRPFFGDRLALAHVADQPPYREVYAALTRMLFYNIHPRKIEDVVTFEPGQFLPRDGSNLASVFFRLASPPNDVDERINEYLRLILPGLVRVRVSPVLKEQPELPMDSQKVGLLFEQRLHRGMHLFWPSQMSEGTLRSLGILTALLQGTATEGPRPSLVAIEEPEAQVHPAALGVLRDAMVEASYSTQVLVTTQSADLLENKDVDTDSILVATADEGATRIAPINEAGRDLIRRQLYSPAELLRIGHLYPGNASPNGSTPANQPEKVGERS